MLELQGGAELACVLLVVEQEEVARLLEVDLRADELGERGELVDRPERDAHVQLVRELGPDASGRLARGARGELVPLEEDDVRYAEGGEVVGDARAHDSAADDHDLCRLVHGQNVDG